MKYPLVSVCIPVYHSAFLRETLESINHQDYKNIEVLLVNDGDDWDYTPILSSFNNLKIKYIHQPNQGAGAARNTAFKESNGKYIKFLDADDLLNEHHLMEQVQLAEENPEAIISGKWGRFYHNDLNSFKLEFEDIYKNCDGINWVIESWLKGPSMTQPGMFLIPKGLIEKHGLWKEELSKGPCDDLEFFTRMILNADGMVFCEPAILYYRSGHSNNLSGLKSKISFEWYFKTMRLASTQLLEKTDQSLLAKKAAATQYSILAYKAYPYHSVISKLAFEMVEQLGGSNYPFPAGGITKVLNSFVGWRNTIKLKKILGFKKFN